MIKYLRFWCINIVLCYQGLVLNHIFYIWFWLQNPLKITPISWLLLNWFELFLFYFMSTMIWLVFSCLESTCLFSATLEICIVIIHVFYIFIASFVLKYKFSFPLWGPTPPIFGIIKNSRMFSRLKDSVDGIKKKEGKDCTNQLRQRWKKFT